MATKRKRPNYRRSYTAPRTFVKVDRPRSGETRCPRMRSAATGNTIDEFVDWYYSEPRLSFIRTVVLTYRMHLESRNLAPPAS